MTVGKSARHLELVGQSTDELIDRGLVGRALIVGDHFVTRLRPDDGVIKFRQLFARMFPDPLPDDDLDALARFVTGVLRHLVIRLDPRVTSAVDLTADLAEFDPAALTDVVNEDERVAIHIDNDPALPDCDHVHGG